MIKIKINAIKCTGCEQCIKVCPMEIYIITKGKAKIDEKKTKTCLICRACEVSCPNKAIKIE